MRWIAATLLGASVCYGAPDGTLVVLNKADATASFIDRQSGKTTIQVDVGDGPHEVAVSPDGHVAVVANYGAHVPGSSLSVIDVASAEVLRTIDLGRYQRPHGIMYLSDGERVVVTCEQQQSMLVVNVGSGEIESAISTDQQVSHMVVLDPVRPRAYVSSIGSGSVSVLDLDKEELVRIIPTAPGAEGIDVSPDGREVWVGNRAADGISVIDAETLEVIEAIDCGAFPIRVKFTPDGGYVLISNARSGDVAVFDASTRKEVRRIRMSNKEPEPGANPFASGPVPIGILIPPDGKQAYIANTNVNLVTVIDLETWAITDRIETGNQPDGMAFSAVVTDSGQ